MARDYLYRRLFDPRLAPWQPFHAVKLQPVNFDPNPLPEGRVDMPDRAPGPLRAPYHAYWIEPRRVDVPFVQDIPRGSVLMPSAAPGAPPPANTAYWIGLWPNPPEAPPAGRQDSGTPSQLTTPRRAAFSVYWQGLGVPPPEELPPGLRVRVSDPVRLPPASPCVAYSLLLAVPPPENATDGRADLAIPRQLFEPRRAAPDAYWHDNRIVQDAAEDTPKGMQLCPDRAPGYQRATADAYNGGGGTVDWFAFGAATPGDCYHPNREGTGGQTKPPRLATNPSSPQRANPTIAPATRPPRRC